MPSSYRSTAASRNIAATPPGPPWPEYRLEALRSLREQLAQTHLLAEQQTLSALANFLTHEDTCSFVLPPEGRFIPLETPAVLSPQIILPAARFTLEYRIRTLHGGDDNDAQRAAVMLLMIERTAQRRLMVKQLVRSYGRQGQWTPGMADFVLEHDSHINFTATGQTLQPLVDSAQHRQAQDALDLCSEYRLLAHFLMIYNAPNISKVRISAPHRLPNHYYTLRCNGPTPFAWLPESGLRPQ